MLNRKIRQIRTLQARLERVVQQRDEAVTERDAAVRLNGRLAQQVDAPDAPDWEAAAKQIAKDRAEAEHANRWHIGRLKADIDGLAELCNKADRRLQRLARAVWRLRKTLADQEAVIAELTRRVDHWEGGDRALRDAVPAASDAARIAELERELARRNEQIRGLDRQIAVLETANRSTDWQQLRAAS
jgi:predicted RNase H-like nuclease (RuvC/YqgF family)